MAANSGNKMGLKLLFSVMLLTAQADDFFFPQDIIEDENLEEEVDFPGGDITSSRLRPDGEIPREPFNILLFDDIKLKWREPNDEKELVKEGELQLDRAWHHTVLLDMDEAMSNPEKHHTSKTVLAGNIHHFFSKYMNPSEEALTGEEDVLLNTRVEELRKHEGLLDDNFKLNFGYLCRGYPRKILDSTMIDLKKLRDTTGERRLIEEIQANRERPLLQRRAAEKIAAELKVKEEKENAELAAASLLVKEDRDEKKRRLAEKAAARMKAAENKRTAD